MIQNRRQVLGGLALAACLPALPAAAETAEVIDARVDLALRQLFRQTPGARTLADRSKAVLVMPSVVKGGFVIGAAYGEGALRLNDGGFRHSAGYYSVAAASLGLQLGIQRSSHALFFLTEQALKDFRTADGWEIGADAEVVLADRGARLDVSSTEINQPVIGMVFGEDGLMFGASLEGSKYSPVKR